MLRRFEVISEPRVSMVSTALSSPGTLTQYSDKIMATPIRKKRNFKALQLVASPPISPVVQEPDPIIMPTRQAPPAGGKKRPPPMTLKAPKIPVHTPVEPQEQEANLLTVHNGSNSAPNTASPSRRNTYHATLSSTLANLDMNSETKYELRNDDFKDLHELGQGNGGSVKKVEHVPTGTFMAKKVCLIVLRVIIRRIALTDNILNHQIVLIDAKPSVRKQILRELQIMHDCNSKYIISFYGAFLADPNICICMEFMDKGSLDGIYKKIGAIDIDIVGKVALAVLEGLTYLYDVHRIIHRGKFSIAVSCLIPGLCPSVPYGMTRGSPLSFLDGGHRL